MKLGFNLLLWTGHVTPAHEATLRALKKTGYDGVEIPLFEGDVEHYRRLGELIAKIGLEVTTVSVLGAGYNPLSPDKAQQKAALDRAKWVIDCSAALGAEILGGPMHSELGYLQGLPGQRLRSASAAFRSIARPAIMQPGRTCVSRSRPSTASNAISSTPCSS